VRILRREGRRIEFGMEQGEAALLYFVAAVDELNRCYHHTGKSHV
jgi:hypothetical protein